MKSLQDCTLCPRNCHVDRTKGHKGYCGQTTELMVARAALHMWEEPCISGDNGSGTVFFSGCSLGCVYCQNQSISRGLAGKSITVDRLSDIFLELQLQGANNINLVTPTHFVPQIIQALDLSRGKGLHLPIVYNTSGYEKVETLKLLEGYVDIYLPDIKYKSEVLSQRYSHCRDYFSHATGAIREMVQQVGTPVFDSEGIMTKGVIVRHLALPGCTEDSREVLRYLYEIFGDQIFISIMNQYTPLVAPESYSELSQFTPLATPESYSELIQFTPLATPESYSELNQFNPLAIPESYSELNQFNPLAIPDSYPELKRKLTGEEYDALVDYAIALGIENGFIQEGETASESFIPAFDGYGV